MKKSLKHVLHGKTKFEQIISEQISQTVCCVARTIILITWLINNTLSASLAHLLKTSCTAARRENRKEKSKLMCNSHVKPWRV